MSRCAEYAAELWELEDLDQPDPTQADMEPVALQAGPLHISEHSTNPVQTTNTAACQEPGMNGALSSEGAAASSRAFCVSVPLPVQLSAPGGRWTPASLTMEVPHVA